jgi:hypothetical protein
MISKFTRKDFLEALFAQYYKEHRGFILVKSLRRGDPKMSTRYFPNIEILAKEHYGEERDVYFGICPRERMKAEKEHIHYLVALWADLDIGPEGHEEKNRFFEGPQQAAKAIRGFPRAPSIIVESGRGAHLYWLLKEITEVDDPERIEKLLKNIGDHLNCDTDCSLDTVLRLPETVNTKISGKPVNCEVKFINPNFRYDLHDFENLAQRVVAPPQRSAVSPPPPPPPPPPTSGSQEVPSFSEDQDDAPVYDSRGSSSGMEDSLVLDETIIDELIDDISMTGSSVAEAPTSSSDQAVVVDEVYDTAPLPPPPRESRVVAVPKQAPPVTVTTSTALERLSSTRTEVEISLLGSGIMITGLLMWQENGLIGVQAGEDLYTIPLSSISFIKSSAL